MLFARICQTILKKRLGVCNGNAWFPAGFDHEFIGIKTMPTMMQNAQTCIETQVGASWQHCAKLRGGRLSSCWADWIAHVAAWTYHTHNIVKV